MSLLKLEDFDLRGKRVLVREDFNVPMQQGQITNDIRLQATLPTIQLLMKKGAKILLMSHLGRPQEGIIDKENSLAPVADRLAMLLEHPVRFVHHPLQQTIPIENGEVVLLENTRFLIGEEANEAALSKALAALCDVYVMDAFASSHRKHASTYGVAEYAPLAIAGPLLQQEVNALQRILSHPDRPLVAIVGGAKVSSKLALLENLLDKVDTLIVGGGIANTFLAASGKPVGNSLIEPDLLTKAQEILHKAKPGALPLPTDVRTATEFVATAAASEKLISDIQPEDRILDIGPETEKHYQQIIHQAGTILWNGPVGVFEFANFQQGTKAIANAIKNSSAFSVAGGGDTIAAIDEFGLHQEISYISTGGGAFLTYLEQGTLPCIEVLACKS